MSTYKKILVPTDGSDTAARGLEEAVRLAKDQGAKLRLLYVLSDAHVSAPLLGVVDTGELLARIRNDAQAILDKGRATALAAGVQAETAIVEWYTAHIGEAVIDDAEKSGIDLIVMGTHGRRGFARAVLGSAAEFVARHTRIPLLLLRS